MRQAASKAHGPLGSLDLVIAGEQGPGCAFGDKDLLRRRVPGQGPSFQPWLRPPLLRLSQQPGGWTAPLALSTCPSAKNQ